MSKSGFIYLWFDRKRKRYYIGSHWGSETDGYVCSSKWMRDAYRTRASDFKRRILIRNIHDRKELFLEEQRWLNMIDPSEIKPLNDNPRYYNLSTSVKDPWYQYPEKIKTVGEKISAAKKGKKMGPCSPEKAKAISEAKKKKFAERGGMSAEHKAALTGIKKKAHTDEWKQENSERFKQKWADPEFRAKQSESRKAAWSKRRAMINTNESQIN